ncbi:MAG: GNAT family N-acetyltransferase [Candidatus Puniceispirillales bacterium]
MDVICRPIIPDDLVNLEKIGGHRVDGLADWLEQKAFAGLVAHAPTDDQASQNILGYIVGFSVDQDAEIIDLFVRPAYRRKGIARLLIEQFCHRFGNQMTYLEVARLNSPAHDLYQSVGFIEYGVRKAYYHTAEGVDDAILMRKQG